jgi:hypothetical protein
LLGKFYSKRKKHLEDFVASVIAIHSRLRLIAAFQSIELRYSCIYLWYILLLLLLLLRHNAGYINGMRIMHGEPTTILSSVL